MRSSVIEAHRSGRLQKAKEQSMALLRSCCLCPRRCRVNRLEDERGFCRTGLKARVYSAAPHHGEEPAISGTGGSGTVFFSGCNLRCVYCQNHQFSQTEAGRELSQEELSGLMLGLQEEGCHNLNLVTPTHALPQILQALDLAIERGFRLPIVYNTSGYELAGVLRLLEGIVDIYLPDMRYSDPGVAERLSEARDYPERNREALKEMFRQVGVARFDVEGVIERGLVIRHLVLPNGLSGTREILGFVARELSPEVHVSLMSQYRPYHRASEFPEIARQLKPDEYDQALEWLEEAGLENGWVQELGGNDDFAGVHFRPNL